MAAPGPGPATIAARYADVTVPLQLDGALAEGVVPALGQASIAKLKLKDGFNIQTWAQLYGHYFLTSLNEAEFAEFLTSEFEDKKFNLLPQQANEAAKHIFTRFDSYGFIDPNNPSVLNKQAGVTTKAHFTAQPLPRGPLKAGFIPSLGEKTVECLVAVGVKTFEQLFGLWFLNGCTEAGVLKALQSKKYNVRDQEAKPLSLAIHDKLAQQGW